MNLSVRQLSKVIRKLRIRDNDIILVKSDCAMATAENLDLLANAVGRTGAQNCIVVLVDSMDDIDSLSKDTMAKHGWVKTSVAAATFINNKEKENAKNDGV